MKLKRETLSNIFRIDIEEDRMEKSVEKEQ